MAGRLAILETDLLAGPGPWASGCPSETRGGEAPAPPAPGETARRAAAGRPAPGTGRSSCRSSGAPERRVAHSHTAYRRSPWIPIPSVMTGSVPTRPGVTTFERPVLLAGLPAPRSSGKERQRDDRRDTARFPVARGDDIVGGRGNDAAPPAEASRRPGPEQDTDLDRRREGRDPPGRTRAHGGTGGRRRSLRGRTKARAGASEEPARQQGQGAVPGCRSTTGRRGSGPEARRGRGRGGAVGPRGTGRGCRGRRRPDPQAAAATPA